MSLVEKITNYLNEDIESKYKDNFVKFNDGTIGLVQSTDKGKLEVDMITKDEKGNNVYADSMVTVHPSKVSKILTWDEIKALKIKGE